MLYLRSNILAGTGQILLLLKKSWTIVWMRTRRSMPTKSTRYMRVQLST